MVVGFTNDAGVIRAADQALGDDKVCAIHAEHLLHRQDGQRVPDSELRAAFDGRRAGHEAAARRASLVRVGCRPCNTRCRT